MLLLVLLLTPFDEILIAAAVADGGILGVILFPVLFTLVSLFVTRRTVWGRRE